MTTVSGKSFGSINPIGVVENALISRSRVDAALLHKVANDARASEEGLDDEWLVVVKNGCHLELKQGRALTLREELIKDKCSHNEQNGKKKRKTRPLTFRKNISQIKKIPRKLQAIKWHLRRSSTNASEGL